MFSEFTQPTIRVGTRRKYAVPISILSHGAVLVAVAVIPLLATDVLPKPSSLLTWVTPVPPAPPTAPPPRSPDAAPPPVFVSPPTAQVPFEAPSAFSPEPFPVLPQIRAEIAESLPIPKARALDAPPASREALRVGGDIKAPAKVFDARPIYPAIAKAARLSGVVFLEAIIGKDGRVKDLRVIRSAGVLDQAAIDAVSQWRYTPTMLNGEAVDVIMSVTVNFHLQ